MHFAPCDAAQAHGAVCEVSKGDKALPVQRMERFYGTVAATNR